MLFLTVVQASRPTEPGGEPLNMSALTKLMALFVSLLAGVKYRIDQAFDLANAAESMVRARWGRKLGVDELSGRRRVAAKQTQTVLTVVTLGLVIILGILVYSEVEQGLPTPSNTDLSNASSNATGDFSSAMELAPVIMIVLIAAVVLGVVQRFR